MTSVLLNRILFVFVAALGFWPGLSIAQEDTSRITWTGDFRFRLEEDWDSRRSDGTFRDNRTRLRYRLRLGMTYRHNEWAEFGARIRTGTPRKQQDPQLTLGEGFREFDVLPLGFEKAYFQAQKNGWTLWLGKNTFPFHKQNELFWIDHVYPEGVAASREWKSEKPGLEYFKVVTGHFVGLASGASLGQDGYLQGIQVETRHANNRLRFFPSLYLFRNLPDIPDGGDRFLLDYSIVHGGLQYRISKKHKLDLELDVYQNLEDYSQEDSMAVGLRDENLGWTAALRYGQLKNKGDWTVQLAYTYLERWSAVDYFAQNDWARWDYSNQGSQDGRLTNMQGIELYGGYALDDNLTLRVKYYWVEQLVPLGSALETNQRIRFDLDIGF